MLYNYFQYTEYHIKCTSSTLNMIKSCSEHTGSTLDDVISLLCTHILSPKVNYFFWTVQMKSLREKADAPVIW